MREMREIGKGARRFLKHYGNRQKHGTKGMGGYNRCVPDRLDFKGVYMKVSPHFSLQEFIPQGIWDQYGPKSLWFVDMRLIEGAEWLRGYFNAAIIINNWHAGGPFQNRGFRVPDSPIGGKLSQHRFGRAMDFNVVGIKPQKVWSMLVDDWQTVAQHTAFTTLEDVDDTPSWTHIDLRYNKSNEVLIVKP